MNVGARFRDRLSTLLSVATWIASLIVGVSVVMQWPETTEEISRFVQSRRGLTLFEHSGFSFPIGRDAVDFEVLGARESFDPNAGAVVLVLDERAVSLETALRLREALDRIGPIHAIELYLTGENVGRGSEAVGAGMFERHATNVVLGRTRSNVGFFRNSGIAVAPALLTIDKNRKLRRGLLGGATAADVDWALEGAVDLGMWRYGIEARSIQQQ